MKKLLLAAISFLLTALCFAGGGGYQYPPTINFLVNDRIRNTPAVDPEVSGTGIRFYVTTFGLERFDGSLNHQRHAPLPKPGSLIRFGIQNSSLGWPWIFSNVIIDSMDQLEFNEPGQINPNCYSVEDETELQNYYCETLTYTDGHQYTEAYMRYESGTGFWASPVFYKDDNYGTKHLIILNKSGCLMRVNVSQQELTVDWKVDLRSPERDNDSDTFKFEFMATPVLLDDKLYIAGIKQIHVVDVNDGTLIDSYLCQHVADDEDDYFETPLVFDTQPDPFTSLYVISRKGKPYKVTVDGTPTLISSTVNLGESQSPPIIDSDGHVYFVAKSLSGQHMLNYVQQNNRILVNEPLDLQMESIEIPLGGEVEVLKSQILTDFTQNMYILSDNNLIRLKEEYDFDSVSPPPFLDPVEFSLTNLNYSTYSSGTERATSFPGNHPLLSYHNNNEKTMIFGINNTNNTDFGSGVNDYYPSNSDQYNLSNCSINLMYFCFPNAFDSFFPSIATPRTLTERQSWGGIAPYISSSAPYQNALFGDECGAIISYNEALASMSVGFNPTLEGDEGPIPEMGYTKYMKNQDNIPTNNEVEEITVYIYGLNQTRGPYTYVNSYARENAMDTLPDSEIDAVSATFRNLLPNKRYRIAWQYPTDSYTSCENIEIDNNTSMIILNANPDLIVEDTPNDPDLTTEWEYPEPLHFSNVTLEDNAHWRIGNHSNITVSNLILGSGSIITIGEGALLLVRETVCNSTPEFATLDVDGQRTGVFRVSSNLELAEGCKLQIKGYNLQSPSYIINTAIIKTGASLEMKSMNALETSDLVSASIGSLQNRGEVLINDCVKCTDQYIDTYQGHRGQLTIKSASSDFGHFIWEAANSTIMSPFKIGDSPMTEPSRAKLTIMDANCTFGSAFEDNPEYEVYGNIVIKGSSRSIVNEGATLFFKSGSKLDLLGNMADNTGAELIANSLLYGEPGTIRFAEGVYISGYKPDPNPRDEECYGDRIRTEDGGKIEGIDIDNPRKLIDMIISTSHPNNLKWDGIYIDTSYDDLSFELGTNNRSVVSGINKIEVKYPGVEPSIEGVVFENCTYGVYSFTDVYLFGLRDITVTGCQFRDCNYGIYLEDRAGSNYSPMISADINNCDFGDDSAESGFNFVGIALNRATNVRVNDCNFYCNGYGIMSLQSSVLVGGSYDPDDDIPTGDAPCNFYNNEKAGICFEQSSSTQSKSLVYRNLFSGDLSTQTATSGNGIWANESVVDIIDNDFTNLGWHGMLLNGYTYNPHQDYHGFAANNFQNNQATELIGDVASLSSSRGGENVFNDARFIETGIIPKDPLEDFDAWDKYILANLSNGIATMEGNIFVQSPYENGDRFYPSLEPFSFDRNMSVSLSETIIAGMNQFYQGLFNESIQSMKQVVETYPDSMLTGLAIDYLYYATRASGEDYATLRAYLDLEIPSENLATYIKKEEIKTKCHIKEEDYLTAISRLQLILDNPETIADSLFALIDQAYCYMSLATGGAKALPDISIKTPDFVSYMKFLAELTSSSGSPSQNVRSTPQILRIESNYPNPFNPQTTISFSVPREGEVAVTIYNIKGQKVMQLLNEQIVAGRHSVIWNGCDANGRAVSSGLYFARIEQGNKHRTHKMLLLK
ncbi:MAG: T9SS type A sorting domain-containing protein [Candidatus Cloacimonadaceae bacterium]|nr:T9SS type A sorting domain-containing protein [Candidatus Cloacimonadota bacterium]MDY0127163.1 T9SS type A sorting domain-containing protein [Candidatus Cloacimonadaceae bacterium]MCB5255159.1 T9SS type A sorting domain-containing protein [Candidatus Cloacimonadota bacterium]MCK9177632.1 T9SS type A sorting domain-containing protein [Candidatus Cloacimonadota bacterium]MCK9242254.1 T9SS type A sorting domain-containing protein [Candidatus Cloacimonadota bacterium]